MLERLFEKTSLVDVLVVIIASLAIVSFWRGVWGLMDLYIFPANASLSLLVSMGIGMIILLAIAFYKRNPKRKYHKERVEEYKKRGIEEETHELDK